MLAPAIRRDRLAKLSIFHPRTEPETLAAVAKVNGELSRCRYPVTRIKCECDANTLLLTGVTTKYYYAQIALEAAKRHAGSIPVKSHVVVGRSD